MAITPIDWGQSGLPLRILPSPGPRTGTGAGITPESGFDPNELYKYNPDLKLTAPTRSGRMARLREFYSQAGGPFPKEGPTINPLWKTAYQNYLGSPGYEEKMKGFYNQYFQGRQSQKPQTAQRRGGGGRNKAYVDYLRGSVY